MTVKFRRNGKLIIKDVSRIAPYCQRLKEKREQMEMTQQDVAAEAGIGTGEVSRVERCNVNMKMETILKMAEVLDMEVELKDKKSKIDCNRISKPTKT